MDYSLSNVFYDNRIMKTGHTDASFKTLELDRLKSQLGGLQKTFKDLELNSSKAELGQAHSRKLESDHRVLCYVERNRSSRDRYRPTCKSIHCFSSSHNLFPPACRARINSRALTISWILAIQRIEMLHMDSTMHRSIPQTLCGE